MKKAESDDDDNEEEDVKPRVSARPKRSGGRKSLAESATEEEEAEDIKPRVGRGGRAGKSVPKAVRACRSPLHRSAARSLSFLALICRSRRRTPRQPQTTSSRRQRRKSGRSCVFSFLPPLSHSKRSKSRLADDGASLLSLARALQKTEAESDDE